MATNTHKISVIVPDSPFIDSGDHQAPCLCALSVDKLMEWWPGSPHYPERYASKVRSIQRSLDWKRVAQIAAYLLQEEIVSGSECIEEYFETIYKPRQYEPGREWPPKVGRVIGFQPSIYPVFSNILVHINGATLTRVGEDGEDGAARIEFNSDSRNFNLTVIDGQHRINGAFLALQIMRRKNPSITWEIPAEIFIDLDEANGPPKYQAQIFIDVNFYQKKVDRSLVADLFPTARSGQKSLSDINRAQDLGRRLMLDSGPLVGMVQIPGIKYGVKNVIALATLVSAIKDTLPALRAADLTSLNEQADFLVQVLDSWLIASGRKEDIGDGENLTSSNVTYQGRILVSVLNLVPVILWKLRKTKNPLISDKSSKVLQVWLSNVMKKAGFMTKDDMFLDKDEFKKEGFLGSGGIGRFRDRLWAGTSETEKRNLKRLKPESIAEIANAQRVKVFHSLGVS